MADYIHLENLIQGEVHRIKERHLPEVHEEELTLLIQFLTDQRSRVISEKLKLSQTTPADSQ